MQSVGASPTASPEGGDGEPDEERDGGAREREAGAVDAEVPRRPGEGQGRRERLVLVHGALLRRHRAPLGLRRGGAPVPRRRRREAAAVAVASRGPGHPPRAARGEAGTGARVRGQGEREEARVERSGHVEAEGKASERGVVTREATVSRLGVGFVPFVALAWPPPALARRLRTELYLYLYLYAAGPITRRPTNM